MARGRYQRGCLFKRGRSWVGRWREDVRMEDGSVHRVLKSRVVGSLKDLPTKRLARREFDAVLDVVNSLAYRPGRTATFGQFAKKWQAEVVSMKKASTQRVSAWHLRAFLNPVFEAIPLEQIGIEQAQRLICSMAARVAPKTVKNAVGTLSAILSTAKDWGYRAESLNWRRLTFPRRTERKQPAFFSAQQAAAIIERAQEPFQTLFAVAAMTGARAGELLALKVTDIDLDRRLIFIRRSVWYGHVSSTKSLAGDRVLPVPLWLAERLRVYIGAWKPNEQQYLFATSRGNPIPMQHVVQRKLWPILDELKIKRCGLHAFRHTAASLLVEIGAPMTVAREQLGHTDMRLTLGVYSHVIGNDHRDSIEKMAARMFPNVPMRASDSNLIN